jgi:putative intracellular protease/amidase
VTYPEEKQMNKQILFVLSEWGYWGEELIGPLEACDAAGYEITFVTPTGRRPVPHPVSMNPGFVDPPLGRSVVSAEMAEKTRAIDASDRLDNPINLANWFPVRPYPSSPTYLRDMEAYYAQREDLTREDLAAYDALVIVGGSGALVDLANNQRLHDLLLGFCQLDKLVVCECYGVSCLPFAREIDQRASLLWGKRVTGHVIEYDYLDGTAFAGPHAQDGSSQGFGDGYINFGPPFYPLEYILRDAVGPDGEFIGNVGQRTSVILDWPFLSSRSTASSVECGRVMVETLEQGSRRYGW